MTFYFLKFDFKDECVPENFNVLVGKRSANESDDFIIFFNYVYEIICTFTIYSTATQIISATL